jgi:hypothetical protein
VKKRWRGAFTAAIVATIAITNVLLFLPETAALAWHVGHGSSAETNGIKLHVPTLYWANLDSSSKPTLNLTSLTGRARFNIMRPSKLRQATISFRFDKLVSPPEVASGRWSEIWTQRGYQQTAERPATLAGRQGKCREYSGAPLQVEKTSFGDKDIQIFCYFGNDILAIFGGTPAAADDFYNIIQTAQAVQGKD